MTIQELHEVGRLPRPPFTRNVVDCAVLNEQGQLIKNVTNVCHREVNGTRNSRYLIEYIPDWVFKDPDCVYLLEAMLNTGSTKDFFVTKSAKFANTYGVLVDLDGGPAKMVLTALQIIRSPTSEYAEYWKTCAKLLANIKDRVHPMEFFALCMLARPMIKKERVVTASHYLYGSNHLWLTTPLTLKHLKRFSGRLPLLNFETTTWTENNFKWIGAQSACFQEHRNENTHDYDLVTGKKVSVPVIGSIFDFFNKAVLPSNSKFELLKPSVVNGFTLRLLGGKEKADHGFNPQELFL